MGRFVGRSVAIVAAAVVALVAGATPAAAETDGQWDYRPANVGGSYRAHVGNFAGDSAHDILWYAPGPAADHLWIGREGRRGQDAGFTSVRLTVGGDYHPIIGDFGGDDYTDILWYGPGSMTDSLWISDDSSDHFDKSRKVNIGGHYLPSVLRDYRAETTKDDILFLGPGAAKDYLWHFRDNGSATYASRPLSVNGAYQLVVGDYNGDRIEDVMLYAPGSHPDYLWHSSTSGAFRQTNHRVDGNYEPTVVYQQDRDGILWWTDAAAQAYWWQGTPSGFKNAPFSLPVLGIPATPHPLGVNSVMLIVADDVDGIFWPDGTANPYYELASPGHDITTQVPLVGDFDADGYADVVWFGAGGQTDELWYTDTSGTSGAGAPAADAGAAGLAPAEVAPAALPEALATTGR